MRIASFNLENLFRRPKVLNQGTWAAGRDVLDAYSRLQKILEKPRYRSADKRRILELLDKLGLRKSDDSEWVVLRRSRGQLLARHRDGSVEVRAEGRGDWIGWLELKREAVDEAATRNTARVVAELDADVLAVIEAEDRPALQRFNQDVLPLVPEADDHSVSYTHVMLVDGNDDRGIDVGLLTKDDEPIDQIRSHVDDRSPDGALVFSRDCPEYEVTGPDGQPILILVNHFKSKGYGKPAESTARRLIQARRVKEIYEARRAAGWERVAVVGDFNDTPDSDALAPLLHQTDLRDVSEHPAFEPGERSGTFGSGNEKIDYILLAPALYDVVEAAGIFRKGVWHGPHVQNPWPMFDTLTRPEQAASDRAAIWADLAL